MRGVELSLDVLRDGEPDEVWLRIGAEPMVMDGAPHVTVALDDITDRRRAERDAAESEERFEQFADHFPGYFVHEGCRPSRTCTLNRPEATDGGVVSASWLGKRPRRSGRARGGGSPTSGCERLCAGDMVDELVRIGGAAGEVEHFHSVHLPHPAAARGLRSSAGSCVDVTQQVEAEEEVRRQAEQLRRTVEGAVLAMSQVVETRDPYTAGHERRVAELATVLGRELGMDGGRARRAPARLADPRHRQDRGARRRSSPSRAASARSSSTSSSSTQSGYEILSVIDFGRPVAEMVLQHHERLDGSGYPKGLTAASELLLETRILAVADVVEAMSSHRPYRAALGREAALAEIRDGAGTRYDPDVVAACERAMVEGGFRFSP